MGKFDGYLLVSDMDATLLTDEHIVSPKNRQAIEYFIENGGLFTVASGRMVDAVRAYLHMIPINAPAVLHNGAKLYDFSKEQAIYEEFIEEERKQAVRRVYNDFPEIGIEIYANETVYVYRECIETARFKNFKYKVVYSLPEEMWQKPWTKVLFIAEREVLDKFEPIFREKYDSKNTVRSGSRYFDMVSDKVSKGTGVLNLARLYGIDRKNIIAVGDNMNDVDMLKAAGISWAVENAEPAAKSAAAYIAPDNNSDAIAYITEHIKRED